MKEDGKKIKKIKNGRKKNEMGRTTRIMKKERRNILIYFL